ncbi:class I SAM-dependent methyltransferase [uncultured Lutibacter sp.]|uniref:class I SAM-dependent DNA methyltransferase n=1 Tax=uncultured Lutibacter sp. TaxID=437739 RepID=UPI00260D9B86|nr:class I SAM-dependent methyltransferase [uncultured Lutibacter sp.]
MSNFKNYSKYYDLLYKDKNYEAESQYVVNKIKEYFPKAKQIIDLGSGSGAHAKYFCKEGYSVIGIEKSEQMLLLSKEKQIKGFKAFKGDISNYNLSQKFDVAISLFHVISYLNENDAVINCFKTTYNQLNKNGIFIFDVWYTPAVYHQKPNTKIKRFSNDQIDIVRISESRIITNKNLVEVDFQVLIIDKMTSKTEKIKEKHIMRHFSIPEIKILAELTGFEVLCVEEFLTGKSPSENTWGVCFLLKKI